MVNQSVYLDYNATAPLLPDAFNVVQSLLSVPSNASSVHSQGRAARSAIEKTRFALAEILSANAELIVFNSGATEANNTVLQAFRADEIAVSSMEHHAVLDVHPDAIKIPVTSEGVIDLGALEHVLKSKKPKLVSAMWVNNETGVIQPVTEVFSLCRTYNALFHCDAVQALGRVPINLAELPIDFLTLSSHKIGGPHGCGVLVSGFCGETPVLLHGGGQEKNRRAGTENVAAIAGFGVALSEISGQSRNDWYYTQRNKIEYFLQNLSDSIVIHGKKAPRVPNTCFFSCPGLSSETLMMAMDLEGIALSNGSACTSGTVNPSHVLKTMGYGDDVAASALRLSMGWATTEQDIERFCDVFETVFNRMTKR